MRTRHLAPIALAVALLSVPWTARAQPQSETYPYSTFRIQAPQLPIPTNAVASYAGAPGGSTWSYWVYATYIGGASGLSNRATVVSVGTIAGGTPVQVAWAAQTGALSYTVLKTANQTQPAAGCSCVLAAGVTVPRATDTGGALAAWTVPTQPGLTYGNFILDQRDFATPTWVFTPPLTITSGNTTVTLDGTEVTTGAGEIVYLGATGLEASTNYLRNAATGAVTQNVVSATFPIADGYTIHGFGATHTGIQIGHAAGTIAAPLYPIGGGDILGNLNFQGFNENTGGFATGGGIIADTGTQWTATNNDASIDLYINETGTVGNGITLLTLTPGAMGVGVGYNINTLTGGLDGDLHVADNRAVTGDTEVIIQAGAGQTSNLLQLQNNAGTALTTSIDARGVIRSLNAALEPVDCVAGIVGSQYFDTDDQRLCICANDGTDIEWVRSDDYSHLTGHCTF